MSLSLNDHLSEVGISKWAQALSIPDAAERREGIRTSLSFFATHMPFLSVELACSFLRAMDLTRPVRVVTLTPGDRVIAFRLGNESQFKLFYTRSGSSVHQLGVNPAGRSCVHFRVRVGTTVLESYTSGAVDCWTVPADGQPLSLALHDDNVGYMAAGGHVQLLISRSYQSLEVLPVGATFGAV